MDEQPQLKLGRRERQILDVVYRLGRASVAQVRSHLPDPLSYSTVRAMMGLLEGKGCLRHEAEGLRYIYFPTIDARQARKSALRHVVKTFFGGSIEQAVATLLQMRDTKMSARDRERLRQLIRRAKQEGR